MKTMPNDINISTGYDTQKKLCTRIIGESLESVLWSTATKGERERASERVEGNKQMKYECACIRFFEESTSFLFFLLYNIERNNANPRNKITLPSYCYKLLVPCVDFNMKAAGNPK